MVSDVLDYPFVRFFWVHELPSPRVGLGKIRGEYEFRGHEDDILRILSSAPSIERFNQTPLPWLSMLEFMSSLAVTFVHRTSRGQLFYCYFRRSDDEISMQYFRFSDEIRSQDRRVFMRKKTEVEHA